MIHPSGSYKGKIIYCHISLINSSLNTNWVECLPYTVCLFLYKEVDDLIAESDSLVEELEIITENSVSGMYEPETEVVKKQSSVSVQTIPLEYVGRNRSTQTCKKLEKTNIASKASQTMITNDFFTRFELPKKVSTYSQTDPIDVNGEVDDVHNSLNNEKFNVPVKLDMNNGGENSDQADHDQEENELDLEFEGDESCDDEFSPTSGEESESDEGHHEDNEARNLVTLSSDKPIQDQLKLIICEESMATTFRICFKCISRCLVSVGDIIGSYCKFCISCCSSPEHNITWSTGPLLSRLTAFNLLIASTILSTGLECNKTLRLMESLNILCLKRCEFSVQSAYVIPAVINVWRAEQRKLHAGIEGKAIEVASDMRVDSPGHCGLLGSGSTLDPDRNVISILK